MALNDQVYFGFYRGKGDASRNDGAGIHATPALLVPATARDLHFASAADAETDWNVSNPTNPTLYVHSETTPATDYLSLSHDGTTGLITSVGGTLSLNGVTSMAFQIGGTSELTLTSTALSPTTSDGNALGTTALMWADLFLASGGVINFNNGEVTLTQNGANSLTLAGGDLYISAGFGAIIGTTAGVTISAALASTTTYVPSTQIVGTSKATGSLVLASFNTTDTNVASSGLNFVKSGAAAPLTATAVAADEVLGEISAYGADGTDFNSLATRISFEVDGAVATGDMPGRIVFYTTADGGETAAEALRITNAKVLTTLGAAPANVTAAGAGIFGGGIAFTDLAAAHIDDATHGAGTTTIYIGNQTITTSSDMRLKKDIADTTLDAMAMFRKMRVVDYAWTDPDGTGRDQQNKRGKFVGMLAQEMVDVAPWIINAPDTQCATCRRGEMCAEHTPIEKGHSPLWWYVQYEHLVPALVKGMQEMDARMTALEAAVSGKGKK